VIPAANILAFSLAALLIVLAPGPNILFTIGRALAVGRTAALITVLGSATGMYVQVIAVALGLGLLLSQSVIALTIVKFAGAAFLVYLGIQAIRHRGDAAMNVSDVKPQSLIRTYLEGAFVGLTNPKTIVFFLALLPQFTDENAGPLGLQMLLLGAIFIAIGIVFDSMYAFAASAARDWFGRSPKRLAGLSVAGGIAMICLGIALALTGILFE
jgi:threonine/homoserine/homoserine lactone efflux protein